MRSQVTRVVWGASTPFQPEPRSPAGRLEAGVGTQSEGHARAVAAGCALPAPDLPEPGFEPWPRRDALRCPARSSLLWASVSPTPEVSQEPRPRQHTAKDPQAGPRGGAAASAAGAPAPPAGARTRSYLAVLGSEAGRGGAGMPRPLRGRANRRGRRAPCGATRWGRGLRALRRVRGLAAGGGRPEEVAATAAGPGTATQRAGCRDRAGQAPQPAAAAASP
ncbi:unnamed protein product [Rangifer tarandus platyrhynchus]|uniref:Uncharacterized protein n=1 Tax=Rangifer tarandus platyrhynchus TaxID=3082113 RepID=A0ABN8YES6_RANTA|nr:unnamed protein product [Rangifer tarandus platyrhynchus]